ncbi:Ribosomal large subunit pseudouridine synthase B [Sporotomaculum syntrophicum]|uniref:Pseudouridine synthase n=1 Tax=Sporotomaculum syntrophicum TaxID=182264 RepID=A0A9D2WS80_9FIRM|nr:pseudouridine synthase [Sporotomaculum syntrophicum]KAF1086484.1 Ribosomal large subunit pseudouridine synthase B [Sporotomaculum syntrophicum]
MERLQKFMARSGVASRRGSEELIAQGKVRVNGKQVIVPGFKIDPLRDRVEVDGRPVRKPEKKVYILLFKPAGYVSTVTDPQGRRKVIDLLSGIKQRVYPVGRLDYDSEGLLLLTNDGALTYALTHPRHEIPKTYQVRVQGVPDKNRLEELAKGVVLKDGPTAPAKVRMLKNLGDDTALLEITVHEGKNRQVRRMCEHIGHQVLSLRRISIGPLKIGDLQRGRYRHLTNREVKMLMKMVKIS